MRTSIISIFAFLSLCVGVFSLPAGGHEKAKNEKAKSEVTAIVNTLYATIQQYTGQISMFL